MNILDSTKLMDLLSLVVFLREIGVIDEKIRREVRNIAFDKWLGK